MEFLDVVDEDDNVVGKNTREDIHKKHLIHRGVHVIVLSSKGEILIQKRSKSRSYYPGVFDASVGGHVFSGEGYATAYYGYMWADVLTADAAEAFKESPDGFYDEEMSDKLVKYLFAPRNSMDPADAYRKFRGRDAKMEALMRDRGFPVTTE